MKSLHELIVELESWLSHLRHHAETVSPVSSAPAESPSPQAAPEAPAIPPTTPSGAPNNPILDFYMHSNPQYHDTSGGEDKPRVDTSAATLDFAVVGNGVPIDLTGPKTIVNCPANVVVQINLASGQSGASNSYDVTVNGVTANQPNSQAQYTTSTQGPTVNVSVSCPGLQMEIRG